MDILLLRMIIEVGAIVIVFVGLALLTRYQKPSSRKSKQQLWAEMTEKDFERSKFFANIGLVVSLVLGVLQLCGQNVMELLVVSIVITVILYFAKPISEDAKINLEDREGYQKPEPEEEFDEEKAKAATRDYLKMLLTAFIIVVIGCVIAYFYPLLF